VRVAAIKEMFDRGFGTSRQHHDGARPSTFIFSLIVR
jgi:hypothetical protein